MKKHFFFMLIVILSYSCDKGLNNIPDTGRKIVINGLITTDSTLNVSIGKSSYINDISGFSSDEMIDLENAEVRFYIENDLLDSLYHVPFYSFYVWSVFNSGNYRSKSILPNSGKNYKVMVKAPNLPDASANTVIPNLVKIIKLDTSTIILPNGSYINSNKGVMCKIEFHDTDVEKNYYLFNIREVDTMNYYAPNNNLEFSCQDPIIEEKLFNGEQNEGIAFSDKLINGQTHILNVIIKRESIGVYTSGNEQAVSFRLYSITEEYFRYIQNLNLYSKNFGNPLAEPIMLYSNVAGGYGMFSGASVSSESIVFQ